MGDISGKCSLVIKGNDYLDFKSIDNNIGMMPSKKYKKGGAFSTLAPNAIPRDIWIYDSNIGQDGNVNMALDVLLDKLKGSKNFIRDLSITSDICIRCFVQSDLAQIGFDLSPYVINGLTNLNVRVEISILSWGQVEMD
ncbi:DUF4279 domain-containing protein [Clostridium lacusfryxellense]|uniref:DUF4279 domain-containing protein n=1 Tax=Clostridium lacusfryxellense TaxID=205328 RepID=UPI001C0D4E6F|nr:DUF4279 domain-containing protein [Clostridium lacusfryxellense]MBU3114612.1 DUF4279 domain-containing protein [Clostridium lacusfryxellense]